MSIGTLNEKALHAALKQYVAEPGDQFEVSLDRYVIDVLRPSAEPDGLPTLIEVQTGGFGVLKRKLNKLTDTYEVRLVHPIAAGKWIIKEDSPQKRRKSPKRGSIYNILKPLASIPDLLNKPNFSLQVLMTHEEVIKRFDPKRARGRRRGWVSADRRLIEVVDSYLFETTADLLKLIPDEVEEPFTTAELAAALRQPRAIAQQLCYCLYHSNTLERVGKQGKSYLYAR